MASLGGLALVVVFMLFYYRLTGLNAVISIVVNLVILLGMMAYLGATMTLPGIAGFILTIGMGVDSNVLIFERIKEELAAGKAARAAVNAGFDRVWWTIVDTHVVVAHRGGVPVPVRHRPDPRVRDHADDRPDCRTCSRRFSSHARSSTWCCRAASSSRPSASRASHADFYQRELQLPPLALARHHPVACRHCRRARS